MAWPATLDALTAGFEDYLEHDLPEIAEREAAYAHDALRVVGPELVILSLIHI